MGKHDKRAIYVVQVGGGGAKKWDKVVSSVVSFFWQAGMALAKMEEGDKIFREEK